MVDLILPLLITLSSPPIDMARAELLTRQAAYVESERVLNTLNPNHVNIDRYHYYRLVNNFCLNDKAVVEKYSRLLEWSPTSDSLPERYKVTAALMIGEAKLWKDDLGGIARDMKKTKEFLELAKGGKSTQDVQKSIVDRLDRMIKRKEDEANDSGGAEGKEKGDGQGQEKAKGKAGGEGMPAQDSHVAGSEGKGAVDPTRIRKLAESWGRLPPRERARNLQEITAGMAPRYREAIQNYFRNLSQAQEKK